MSSRISLVAAAILAIIPIAEAAERDKLNDIIDDYWRAEMAANPFSATYSGVNDFNDQTPDVSPAAYAAQREAKQAFRDRLGKLRLNKLSDSDRLNADLLDFVLKHDLALSQFDGWRTPFLADSGFHTSFSYLVSSTPLRTQSDYEQFLGRMRGIDEYINQNIENMRVGIADGFTQPKEILPFILPSFEAQVKEKPQDYIFFDPFKEMPSTIAPTDQDVLRSQALEIISGEIAPAFEGLLSFMRDDYIPNARETVGISDVPDGADYYAALVRYFTTLDDATPESIHELGLSEVARIRAEMSEIIEEVGFEGSFDDFTEFLRTDSQFYATSEQALLERASWISKDIDGRLPAFFGKLPRQPYSVEPVPADIAENYTTGRYVGAPADADRGGQYWVNTYNLKTRPLYQLVALSLHEAVPGHHLQISLSQEVENVPEFRNQFYPHAFGEGWGLYSEKLGVEMGVYQTPYDHFGRLSYEMWRACRLVIDTGLHSKGWTRQQAIDYLAGNTALSRHNVQTEVDRYIAWPGQALAYKMGELTLWELRAKAEEELGDKFDIRAFHDAVLAEGGLPLELLRKQIDEYIVEAR